MGYANASSSSRITLSQGQSYIEKKKMHTSYVQDLIRICNDKHGFETAILTPSGVIVLSLRSKLVSN
jgi:hypothetical protein